ncbi:MAG TPA: ABC transporter permease [Acetobacteraceae bacterium]|jgi:sulfonate transport system permease protein
MRGAVLPILLMLAWETASHSGRIDPRLLPPLEVVAAGAADPSLPGDLAASLLRYLAGFAVGSTAGILFGALLGLSRIAEQSLLPSFDFLKQIAIFAWIPLIAMWFGVGETAKIVFIAMAAFTPVVVNTIEGIRGAPRQLLEVGAMLTFGRFQRIRRIIIPAALPAIVTGLQLALIYAWLATIGAEYFMTAGPGIGGLIVDGRERFQMSEVMLGVVLLGGIGFLFARIAAALESRLLRWRQA